MKTLLIMLAALVFTFAAGAGIFSGGDTAFAMLVNKGPEAGRMIELEKAVPSAEKAVAEKAVKERCAERYAFSHKGAQAGQMRPSGKECLTAAECERLCVEKKSCPKGC